LTKGDTPLTRGGSLSPDRASRLEHWPVEKLIPYGIEISPAYCDVVLRRMMAVKPDLMAVLAATGQTLAETAIARGVSADRVDNPKPLDSRRIRHRGPAPFYGRKST